MNITRWKKVPLFAFLAFLIECIIMYILLSLAKKGVISESLISADSIMRYLPGSLIRIMIFVFNLGGVITLFFVFALVVVATLWNIIINFINESEQEYLIVTSNLFNVALTTLFLLFGVSMIFTKAFLWAGFSIILSFILTFSMLFQFYGCRVKKEMLAKKRRKNTVDKKRTRC